MSARPSRVRVSKSACAAETPAPAGARTEPARREWAGSGLHYFWFARHPTGIVQDSGPIIPNIRSSAQQEHIAPYFGLVRLSWASSAATHALGVIPRVCRKSSTKALGCR